MTLNTLAVRELQQQGCAILQQFSHEIPEREPICAALAAISLFASLAVRTEWTGLALLTASTCLSDWAAFALRAGRASRARKAIPAVTRLRTALKSHNATCDSLKGLAEQRERPLLAGRTTGGAVEYREVSH